MPLSNITIEQLQKPTKDEIIKIINDALAPLTKADLENWTWQIHDLRITPQTITKLIKSKDSKNGQVLRLYQTQDIAGNKISQTRTDWTYYETGEVDVITVSELDPDDKLISKKKIKHFKNGRQPIISE